MKARRVAIGYILGSALAVALVAIPMVPIWQTWFRNIADFRDYVGKTTPALTELFQRKGSAAVAAAVQSEAGALADDRFIVFADPGKKVLAGTLREWPAAVPDAAVTGLRITIRLGAESSTPVIVTHVIMPGGYRLLIGRKVVSSAMIENQLFYGVAGALAILILFGAATAWLLARRAYALRLSDERYERVMLAAQAGFWEWDVLRDEFHVSPRLLEICELPPGTTFSGRADFMRRAPFHPADGEKWQQAVKQLFASEGTRLVMDVRSMRKGGDIVWQRLEGMCFRDAAGNVVRWTGSSTDITEQKCAEEALRVSQERYALAVAGSDDGVWDVDFATRTVFVSARARDLVGMPPGPDVVSMDEWFAALPLHPEDRPRREEAMQAHLKGEVPAYVGEFRLLQPDGAYRWRRLHGLCLRDVEGKPHRMAGSISDIDAHKRAEAALRLSEERYALALEAAEEGHFDNDLETNQIFVSTRVNEIYGFPGQARILNRIEFLNQIPFHPDDRPRILAELSNTDWEDPPGDLHEIECRIIPRPGETRWIHSRAKVVRDGRGRARRRIGVVADITERKLAEEALRQQTERLRLGQAAMRMIIMDWNPAEDLITWSDSPEWLRGPMPPSGRYPPFKDQVHPEDRDSFLATRRRALETLEVQTTEFRLVRTDGEVIWILERKHVFVGADGKAVRMLAAMFDITDRRRAAEALRLSEERYALAMEASEEGHFDWNVRTDEIFASEHLKKVLDLPKDLEYHTQTEMVAHIPFHPGDRERIGQMMREVLAGNELHNEFEFRLLCDQGRELRWHRTRWRIFRDANGEARRVIGVVSDVTAKRRSHELEQELRRAQRLEAMGTLAGGIAHDFNNILGAIVGYGEMALRGAKSGTRLRRDLDAIMSAGERGRALVERILAFSCSGVGERAPVHVEAVVREVLDQLAAKLPEKVTIAPHLDAGRAAMLGDSTQVHQVVMNLTNNGVQAMPQGGVLRVSLEVVRFDAARGAMVGEVAPGDYILLKVSDAGTGIAPDVLEHMFDPFFTTKEVGVGSGLGLSLVHGIVVNVGGAIDVATELGRGSTFTVYLPRSGEAAESSMDEDQPLPRGKGQRVLIVDDEEALTRLASDTLEELGYTPIAFTSSTRALTAFDANPNAFDAILTDERMPGVSGSVLVNEVRRISPSIPIVLMSGFVNAGAALKARELGVNDVLRKPLLARDLAASLARVLDI